MTMETHECECLKKERCEECNTVVCKSCDPDNRVSDDAGVRCVPCERASREGR